MNFHSLFLSKPFARPDRACVVPPPFFGLAVRAGIIWRPNQTDVAQHANSQASVKVDDALTRVPSRAVSRLLRRLESGSDVALHRKQRWHFVWRKDGSANFFFRAALRLTASCRVGAQVPLFWY